MRVLSMTPEQINMLPPAERATYIQLVGCHFLRAWRHLTKVVSVPL